MSKLAAGLLVSAVVAGNIITVILLLGLRDSGPAGRPGSVDDVRAALDSLRQDVERLSISVATRPSTVTAGPAAGERVDLAARFDQAIERLEALERSIAAEAEARGEVTALELREKRREQFRAEDGFELAEELLAERKLVVGANGILEFLDAHPDHPDRQDLMRRARDGFLESGYLDKALWLQGEIMKQFPEHRGGDLYQVAALEKRMKKFDDSMRHLEESLELATTEPERLMRLLLRAELVHERDGDRAGLEAYREVERLARAAGVMTADDAKARADPIEKRLGSR